MNWRKLFKRKKKSIAIAAIFRNEKDYILEWIAWHQSQGFNDFIIYDNESDDGTTELLTKLADAEIIRLHSIPQQEKVQLAAYRKIYQDYKDQYEFIAFIDADEFIMPTDTKKAVNHIKELFKAPNVGAIGLNWRIYGSNGHIKQPAGHVLSNYTMAANDKHIRNHYIKSIYRTDAINNVFAHFGAVKKGFRYINTDNEDLIFTTLKTFPTPNQENTRTGIVTKVSNSKLRLNHYAVKSREEFINKKKNKGDAFFGKNQIKTDRYFQTFDLNERAFPLPESHLQTYQNYFAKLDKYINELTFEKT